MNGSNPGGVPQMNLGFDAPTFFDNLVPKGISEITGPQMIDLFKAGTAAGFSDKDLKDYLKLRGIRIRGNNEPDEASENIEYKTFGTGFDTPQNKR
jgi:hypothetical protein